MILKIKKPTSILRNSFNRFYF